MNCGANNVRTQVPMPVAGTVTNFSVALSTPSAAGSSLKYTLRKNGVLQPIASCSAVSPITLECSAATLALPFNAGDRLDVAVQANATKAPSPGVVTWSVVYH